ncbi:MAG: PEP-CTERM-box response regulator transcription factor [Acidobacteriota bacterium]|jgi:two-component system NtrC family response regulator|nr:PEP-CTERM-box response regulator transcription factor [Acidobacteriota bacterium]
MTMTIKDQEAATASEGQERLLPKILVVDDDAQIRKQLQWSLSDEFRVYSAGDRVTALDIFAKEKTPVVLLDLGLPPHPRDATEGLQALEEMLSADHLAKVIIVSGNSERKNALAAVDQGAYDIFPKPVDLDELKVVLHRVCRRLALEKENIEERSLSADVSFGDIVGTSPAMQEVYAAIRKVSSTDIPVLITGESGTGKELVATAIHNASKRKDGPFVAINCGAIPGPLLESELFGHEKGAFTGASAQRRGRLEYADGGTLFLDEIGDLAQDLQVKLLRFLQEKVVERVGGRHTIPVDGRVIAATNRNLEDAVQKDAFREDLYFRLAVVKIALPPLRDRGDDVLLLAEHMAALFSKELKTQNKKFSKGAVDAIRKYDWPGNIRELQNRVKRAIVLATGHSIKAEDLELDASHAPLSMSSSLKDAREAAEREILAEALRKNSGNISKTAKALGVSRPTLYDLMTRHGL